MRKSIRQIPQKLKSWLSDDSFFYGALLILVAGSSFGLGRWSVVGETGVKNIENKAGITLSAPPLTATAPEATTTEPIPTKSVPQPASVITAVVGSKSGTKYHLTTCSGAKRIKPENLISFESIAAAEAAGYTPAANCPGLQ